MKSILEEFAYGNINPNIGTFKKDSKYGRVMQTIAKSEEKLLSMLDGEAKELFAKFSSAQLEATTISSNDKFIYGYRLGMLMAIEVFKGIQDPIYGGEDLI